VGPREDLGKLQGIYQAALRFIRRRSTFLWRPLLEQKNHSGEIFRRSERALQPSRIAIPHRDRPLSEAPRQCRAKFPASSEDDPASRRRAEILGQRSGPPVDSVQAFVEGGLLLF